MVLKVYILRQEGVEDEGVPGQPGKGGPAGGQVSRVDTTVPKLGESVKGRGGGVQEPGGEVEHLSLLELGLPGRNEGIVVRLLQQAHHAPHQ